MSPTGIGCCRTRCRRSSPRAAYAPGSSAWWRPAGRVWCRRREESTARFALVGHQGWELVAADEGVWGSKLRIGLGLMVSSDLRRSVQRGRSAAASGRGGGGGGVGAADSGAARRRSECCGGPIL